MNREEELRKFKIVKLLKENVVEVVFTKVNGEQRRMKCTLKEDTLPDTGTKVQKALKTVPDNIVAVYDVEKKDWRSFRVENVLDFMPVRED